MKFKIILLFLLLNIGNWMTSQKIYSQRGSVSFQVFYNELSPYGYWVDNSEYGYVWVPNVAHGFRPYATNGYWIYTDEGWTWVSNYSWGWAPFHYGRWYTDDIYGPVWVPDNEWGPGWVSWRRSEGYYGWAPIGPGVSMNVAYGNDYNIPNNRWTFVRDRHFGRRNMYNYYEHSSNNERIIHDSRVINNIHEDNSHHGRFNKGPEKTEVEKSAGRKFTITAVKEKNTPGQNLRRNQLQIYRPQIEKNTNNNTKPAPSKIVSWKDIKTPAKQKTQTSPQIVNPTTTHQQTQSHQAIPKTKPQQSQTQSKAQLTKQVQPRPTIPRTKPQQSQGQIQPTKIVQPNIQPIKPQQPQREAQRANQQHSQQQSQASRQYQQPREGQPIKPQQSQPEQQTQPARQYQQPREGQPLKPQQSQPQRSVQPPHEQAPQPQQSNPSPNKEQEKPPH